LILTGFTVGKPLRNDGTVAVLKFKAVGAPGSKTPLTLTVDKIANDAREKVPVKVIDGSIEIVKDTKELVKGSCYGNAKLGIEDVRCALAMYVGKKAESENMDMDGDRRVTPTDASMILQLVLDRTRRGEQ
jgi:hypothetical protein